MLATWRCRKAGAGSAVSRARLDDQGVRCCGLERARAILHGCAQPRRARRPSHSLPRKSLRRDAPRVTGGSWTRLSFFSAGRCSRRWVWPVIHFVMGGRRNNNGPAPSRVGSSVEAWKNLFSSQRSSLFFLQQRIPGHHLYTSGRRVLHIEILRSASDRQCPRRRTTRTTRQWSCSCSSRSCGARGCRR